MSKLKEDELLEMLGAVFTFYLVDVNYKETRAKYEQARDQIVALIKKPEITKEKFLDYVSRFQKIDTNSDGSRWLAFEEILKNILDELNINYEGKQEPENDPG